MKLGSLLAPSGLYGLKIVKKKYGKLQEKSPVKMYNQP